MDQVRFGLVGIGGMGSSHLQRLVDKKIKGAVITAVCDIKPERLEVARQMCGDSVKYYTDYKEMLASGEVDLVQIATPHYLHPVIAKEAFAAGLHVLTEKPAGVYTKAVREMNEAAAASGKVFGIMYNQRTTSLYRKARELVKNGELGELKRSVWIITNWYRTQAYYNSGGWRATWSGEGGGVLMNQCPHNLDLWQWIFGMPTRVRACCYEGKYHNIEVEDDATIYTEYPNGATGVFISTTGECPGTNRLELSGDRGKIVIEDGKLKFWKLSESEREHTFTSPKGFGKMSVEELEIDCTAENYPYADEAHGGIMQNITDAILYGTPLLAPGEEGINGLNISNAAFLSSWNNGEWIDLPVDEDRFLDALNVKIANSQEKTGVVETVMSTEGTYNS